MGKAVASLTRPLILQSKLLCFSLFYLFATLFLALYSSLSSKCLFRSSPFDPIQAPLFSYPSSYGEHKYALPTLRSSCSSPVSFSDYTWVFKEIQDFCRNSSYKEDLTLKYLQGNFNSFGGSFSPQRRISYFNHENQQMEVPCGFFKNFPISDSDRMAMERCNGVVVVSAIFGDHDKIRQPKGLGSQTLDSLCFFMFVDDITLKGLEKHNLITRNSREYKIGAWRIVKVSSESLYDNPAMNGVIPKHLVHRLFPNSKFSIWIDAKLQLVVDPFLLIHSFIVVKNVDMAISKHPFFVHTMEEAMATARWKKLWDIGALRDQMETYCENGMQPWSSKKLPYTSDVPDTALILRKHTMTTNLYSCLLFNELEAFNHRDQLAFAFVRDQMNPKVKINMFEVEVFEKIVLEYRHNLKHGGSTSSLPKTKRASPAVFINGSYYSKCQRYLLDMWGESHD
ncbi:Protein of unknown function DUF616 [Dillenia turbinata]|uniref:TOD1/MUCI70 glycosyltransferase-like domain-containing protein n=1 Tax=Dillenia turbinata TaxID=194707 RepID=A0AAN8UT99_9MAGN